ncbi:alpha/beta-hydrolase [Delitschia confertaspora ATCC 74209]|uniref:Alpha/beta-hydrolase n=1 Tax=Delitschia confertaspora ATCC 74209 TaxID=1513339 RepID=A0A9P4JDX8_9PLEO|nr:alpha/beta-hydrolase [Delitschia confertaspora ATCC 74209]
MYTETEKRESILQNRLRNSNLPNTFPTPEISTITLESKPSAKLAYTYYPPKTSTPTQPNPFSSALLVFLNGLMLSRSSWDKVLDIFLETRISRRLPYPALLSYDRYGQGESDRDPDDKEEPPCHGHDCMDAVHALNQLLLQFWKTHPEISSPERFPSIIFVCNSIGCALARLYAQNYPGTVSGLLFLDSIIANSDFVSFWPNPDAPDFDPRLLPSETTVEELRETRRKYRETFHPSVPNMEGLSRRNLAQLLPNSDRPKLEGKAGEGPYLTVVAHEWEKFAEENWTGSLHIPPVLTMAYVNPFWRAYNEGLTHITDPDKAIGVVNAVGCSHFIQRDRPEFVADEIIALLDRITTRTDQVRESGKESEFYNF